MRYDKPVVIQVQNSETEEWIDKLYMHAHVNKTGGGQTMNAGADQYRVSLTFEFRYIRALEEIAYNTQPYRLVYRGHTFKVTDYDDYQEEHRTVKITGELYA